jgi:ABC-2 type transport system ATP-binding protein
VLGIEKGRNTPARECSHGMRKKTSFAMALLPNPRALLLDEPFEAVDPVSARLMFDVLRDAAKRGVAFLLTSHILSIIERLADNVALLRDGKLVHYGPLHDASLEQKYFELVESPVTEALEWLGSSES